MGKNALQNCFTVYTRFQTFVAQKFGFAAEIQALQGSPNDKGIIDLCGHYGLGVTAVNAAMHRRYAAKTAGDLQKSAPLQPQAFRIPVPLSKGRQSGALG